MTEEEAKIWLQREFDVSRETWARLDQFLFLLHDEMARQNLISKASAEHIWSRHVVDSAQLIPFARQGIDRRTWLDLGTGAGFPGIIIAILTNDTVKMVESRTRRVAFLNEVLASLSLGEQAVVLGSKLEAVKSFPVDVITARAFAPLDRLISISHRFSTEKTVWLLPKGKNAVREVSELPHKLRKMFHVEQSLTDPEAGILVGKGKLS
ncbi:16S rRNA (guanine(527)-N(7))-methyltransferase RsmG [Parasphingorhabdus halotolerans]|uniref:Ribosomal RNA small subunit methyltransferase G n=1 Tax=Parasphingorhabdus halotolerans TaxID=2725558 RepID=A0A6H2DMU5_9SPHN|nr:16S rRNA (guanine(527)-N(7))-methyltransferase RsmG [Parasphingorhabdus halotolerans]QJB69674.1 16S rRNA (guanine(527)-N(7))-methyltransferase RsmG [Parasphingorhabdus halotolerans]